MIQNLRDFKTTPILHILFISNFKILSKASINTYLRIMAYFVAYYNNFECIFLWFDMHIRFL